MSIAVDQFQPAPPLRNPHVQSVLASLRLRRFALYPRTSDFRRDTRHQLVESTNGARLDAFLTSHSDVSDTHRGTAVLVHGWGGCELSVYVYTMAARLYEAGFDVVRVNMRDHGPSHHLNPGMFHAWRVDDLTGALEAMNNDLIGDVRLIGFSLGGSFVLRAGLALQGSPAAPVSIDAICPAINPGAIVQAIDQGPALYRRYFLKKWTTSLQAKQQAFPDLYDVSSIVPHQTLESMSRQWLKLGYGPCPELEDYLAGYSLTGDKLAEMTIPTRIIAAVGDPIIPISDFFDLKDLPNLDVFISEYGGHCGFVKGWPLDCWLEQQLIPIL